MVESLCVCVCNGRAVRVRGVLSKVHVLCATDSAHLEMLTPPSSAQPGDRVTFNNYPGNTDYTHMHALTQKYTHKYMQSHTNTHTHTHTHTHRDTHTHAHTHTHTHTPKNPLA